MKLYYDRRLSDPAYYAQVGIRDWKKVSTKNVKNFGCGNYLHNSKACSMHYIRNVAVAQIVLENLKEVTRHVSDYEEDCNVRPF